MKNNIDKSISLAKVQIYRPNEQGVALIVVLLFLILIMLAGVMAVRQSNTDLKTATADQINTVLLQSSDSANEKLEEIINRASDPQALDDLVNTQTGIFGYFANVNNINNEYVYCFNPRTNAYQINNAIVYVGAGGTEGSNAGLCDHTVANDYTSDRQTAMTQVSVRRPAKTGKEPAFSDEGIGIDSNNRGATPMKFSIRSTSAIPSYSEPTGCFAKVSSDPATKPAALETLKCLHDKNTPSKMLFTQATLDKSYVTTDCTEMGKGGTLNDACK